MKDDFYKDMNHKRAQDAKTGKPNSGKRNSERPKRETLSRSARHKPKESPEEKPRQNGKTTQQKRPSQTKQPVKQNDESFTNKLKGYFSTENAAKGKAFFAGKFSTYQGRLKNELKISKEKLGSIGSSNTASQNKDSNSKRNKLPWVLALLILIPITVLFAFLIISNFWPSFDDELAGGGDNTEEAAVAEEDEPEFNAELEAQKAEHERRLAENRSGDLGTADIENSFSQEEMQELEEAAVAAIRTKEDNADESATEPADDETDNSEDESTEAATEAEEDTETAPEEEDTDSSDSPNANTTHTVVPGDNTFRIALRYYGDGSAANVQRILEANGMADDNISVGQELIIP